jgi:ATP-dependent helicase/nuclease subunit A
MSAPGGSSIAGSYALDGQAIDKATFYSVACDPSRSVAVESCAGSGKTWLLVSRMLRALLAPVLQGRSAPVAGIEPHQILAITFTRKAAGEMRRRLNELLHLFAGADDATILDELLARGVGSALAARHLPEIRAACARWLVSARPVQVRTIHGWFAALLRGAPLTALQDLGLPLDYALLEDETQALAQLWPRFFRSLHARPGARDDFSALVAAHGRRQIRLALEAALGKRLEFALSDRNGTVDDSVLHFTAQFRQFAGLAEPDDLLWRAGACRDALNQAAHNLGRAAAPSFARAGVELQASLQVQDRAALVEALFTKDGTPRKFSPRIHGLEQIRQAQDFVKVVLEARQQHVAWRYHQSMARLTRIMVDEFTTLKHERAWVDMPDLERAAVFLLGDPVLSGWIQERLDASLRHLLIDEFQDTSPLQWQALHAWLSSYGGASSQTPCLFIVGDPKQSIYRFRGAAPAVFVAAQEFMREALEGALLNCDHTRRNAQAVVNALNGVMAQAQGAGPLQGFRPHSTESTQTGAVLRLPLVERPLRDAPAADAAKENAGEAELGPWRDSLTTARLLPEERLRTLECRQAAAWVVARVAQGAPAGGIMVLARQRDRLVAMEDALRKMGLACEQPERTELGERCEVKDILALVDALVSPGHDLSLARALKSPLFGVSDEDLVNLALQQRDRRPAAGNGAPSWFELICDPGQSDPGWSRIGARLRRWKQWLDRLPCHDALVAIYEDGEVMRRFAQVVPQALRAQVLANLHALIAASLEMDGGRYVTPYALVRRMRRGGVKAAAASAPGAVRLLTIHGAKGLEADQVLVLDCDAPATARARPGVLMDWPVDQAAPVKFAFLLDDQKPPACCAAEFVAEQAARRREETNALYVAMTRARHELVLSALQSARPGGTTWWTQLAPLAIAQTVPMVAKLPDATTPATGQRVRLLTLPVVRIQTFPTTALPPAPDRPDLATPTDSQAANLGSAMHRLLELWPMGCSQPTQGMLQRTAREFDLDPPTLAKAAVMATCIITGAGAWAWDGSKVDWWSNEVEIVYAGQPLRIDRLVRQRDTGHWWVLDYKASGGSLKRPERMAQLSRYRDAVHKAHAGQEVRAAFLGADGGVETLT